ncbi:MAG: 4-hydroxy-tetrahydrodipicolinate synthase [Fibromonadaceae bacterium]|jgi:4-hydroxy-tetrahydrodipicolinate synthase|nr:4-hydroxy-tetrahydrodipicolinate synthase [Fibromonadaceae bacterium]
MSNTYSSQLRGVFPALFTPLKNDDFCCMRNSIDYAKAKKMIDDLIEVGVHGFVPVGTTGQSATLSTSQHLDFIKFVLDYVGGRVPIIAGAGSNSTRESVEMIKEILKIKDVPMLCVTGYYNNPPQEGIYAHFKALSSETGARIIIYNVPGRTANYIHPSTIIRLAEDKNIIGLKQAVEFRIGEKYHEDTKSIVEQTKNLDFAVISGEDSSFIDMLEIGGTALISSTANIPEAAKIFVELYNSFNKKEFEKCDQLQDDARDYIEAVFSRKNPIPLGTFFNSPLLLPLVSVKDTERGDEAEARIHKLIKEKAQSLLKYTEGDNYE